MRPCLEAAASPSPGSAIGADSDVRPRDNRISWNVPFWWRVGYIPLFLIESRLVQRPPRSPSCDGSGTVPTGFRPARHSDGRGGPRASATQARIRCPHQQSNFTVDHERSWLQPARHAGLTRTRLPFVVESSGSQTLFINRVKPDHGYTAAQLFRQRPHTHLAGLPAKPPTTHKAISEGEGSRPRALHQSQPGPFREGTPRFHGFVKDVVTSPALGFTV